MIHIRATENSLPTKFKKPQEIKSFSKQAVQLRNRIFTFLGISLDRIISGDVAAKLIYFPRTTQFYFPLTNAFEIRILAKEMLKQAVVTYIIIITYLLFIIVIIITITSFKIIIIITTTILLFLTDY